MRARYLVVSLVAAASVAFLVVDGNAAGPTDKQATIPSFQTREAFRRAYQDAGSPRLAIFWNRLFGDNLRDMIDGKRIVIETRKAKASGGSDKAFSERDMKQVIIKEEERSDSSRPSPVSEISEFRFQTGYLQPLIEEGARIVDRAAIMRLTDATRRLSDSAIPLNDLQLIETTALKEHADFLIQISMSPSRKSKVGSFFRVSILELKTGRIRASFFYEGIFPKPKPVKVWKAVRGGYILVEKKRRKSGPKIDIEKVGRILSEKTMIALSRL